MCGNGCVGGSFGVAVLGVSVLGSVFVIFGMFFFGEGV